MSERGASALGIPVVAIVGRPNVGKSSLFNLLAGRRVSIVEPTAGVTRDRVTTWIEAGGRTIEIVDTGGMGIVDVERVREHVEQQIELALRSADAVVFVVDAREGTVPLDIDVARRLRALGKPILLVANKVDEQHMEHLAADFYRLGLGDPLPLSAAQGWGRSDLVEKLLAMLPPAPAGPAADEGGAIKIAVVGKRNAGKSTFVNALCDEERMIVSDVPGTTRDAVDVRFERDGEVYVAIDTAGMRKKRRVENAIELFSQARTRQSVERADVVLLVMDVTQEVSIVDKQLASWVEEMAKPCVLVGNKWDLAKEKIVTGEWHEYIQKRLPALAFCPVVFTSALQKKGVSQVLEVARDLHRQARVRVPTGELNRAVDEAMKAVRPRTRDGVMPRVYYVTQTDVAPPVIVVFTSKPDGFDGRYRRYLVNRLRERFDFAEVPIRLVFRERLTIYDHEQRAEHARRVKGRAGKRKRIAEERAAAAAAAKGGEGEGPPLVEEDDDIVLDDEEGEEADGAVEAEEDDEVVPLDDEDDSGGAAPGGGGAGGGDDDEDGEA
jgi:GTP-binding protein